MTESCPQPPSCPGDANETGWGRGRRTSPRPSCPFREELRATGKRERPPVAGELADRRPRLVDAGFGSLADDGQSWAIPFCRSLFVHEASGFIPWNRCRAPTVVWKSRSTQGCSNKPAPGLTTGDGCISSATAWNASQDRAGVRRGAGGLFIAPARPWMPSFGGRIVRANSTNRGCGKQARPGLDKMGADPPGSRPAGPRPAWSTVASARMDVSWWTGEPGPNRHGDVLPYPARFQGAERAMRMASGTTTATAAMARIEAETGRVKKVV